MVRKTSQHKSITMGDLGNFNTNLEQQNISKKSKFRYLIARSDNFEKQIAELLQSLSGYAKRAAKLRDSGDTVAQALSALSAAEVLNPSLKKSSLDLAKTFGTIQGQRDSEVLYLEGKLLPNISQFGESLQKQREEIRSSTSKLFESKDRGSSWIKSSSSTRRRSQSVERTDRTSKEEKALQQSIQRYELHRNLLLKKFMLKLVVSEMRFTIGSLNNLTQIYKQICQELIPTNDLKVFNEFFSFRSLNKSALTEVEESLSGVESAEDDNNSGDQSSDESGLEENNDSDDRTDRNSEYSLDEDTRKNTNSEDDSEMSKGDSVSIQSTLRRFNSTPEIPTNIGGKAKNNQIELIKSDLAKGIKNKSNLKKSVETVRFEADKTKSNKRHNTKNDPDDDSDVEEDSEIEEIDQNQIKSGKSKIERAW